jgi:hypothetical protein
VSKPRNKEDNTLLQALRFISVAQRATGTTMQTHCGFHNGFAYACDSTITAAYPVPDSFDVALHTGLLFAAVERAQGPVTFSQAKNGQFIFRADGYLPGMGDFRAYIPTLERSVLPVSLPDANIAALDDRFKEALTAVSPIATEKSLQIPCASFLMTPGALVGTNFEMMMEAWHGIALPTGLILSKDFATAVCKQTMPITGFGFSDNSVTVYFGDAWIKTQLFAPTFEGKPSWPDPESFWKLKQPKQLQDIPAGLWECIDAVAPHCEDDTVYFIDGCVSSAHKIAEKGASITLDGIPPRSAYKIKNLNYMRKYAKRVEWRKDHALFFGDSMRAIVMGRTSA